MKKQSRASLYRKVKSLSKRLGYHDEDYYKKLYRSSKSQTWLDELDKLKQRLVTLELIKRRKRKIPELFNELKSRYDTVTEAKMRRELIKRRKLKIPELFNELKFRHYTVKETKMRRNTLTVITRHHTVPEPYQLSLVRESMPDIKLQLQKIIKQHYRYSSYDPDTLFRISITSTEGKIISTSYKSAIDLDAFIRHQLLPKATGYQTAEFTISSIDFSYAYSSIMRGYSRSIKTATDKWLTVDNTAKSSCIFHAIVTCRNWKHERTLLEDSEDGNYKRVRSAKDLKEVINLKRKKEGLEPLSNAGGDNDTIQCICDYVKTPIKLYNNIYEEIKHFEPALYNVCRATCHGSTTKKHFFKDIPLYEIQRKNNHCLALIPKRDIEKQYPDCILDNVETYDREPCNEDVMIVKKYVPHKLNTRIATWDIEASLDENSAHVPYACSICWMEGEVQHEKQFWGLQSLNEFLDFIYLDKKFNGYTMYAHNGGKYDINLLLKYALLQHPHWKIRGSSCIELNKSWIGFCIRDIKDEKHLINFKDSCSLLPMSLEKLCIELKVKHKKLPEIICHDDITLQNYMTFPELKTYLSHDVKGLLESMLLFSKQIYDELKIDITKCYTGASLAKSCFFRKYYNHKRYPVFTMSDKHDKFIRDGYFGGRVECFNLHEIKDKKIYYYDFTSLYPSEGLRHLPYGKPEEILLNNSPTIPKDFFGFVRCLVKTKDTKALPIHACIMNGRLTFPIFEQWTEIYCFSKEINYDQYCYQFIEGLKFEKATFMARLFTHCFEKKATCKKNEQAGMSQAWKIIANSSYGFWGLRTRERDGVEIYDSDDDAYLQYLNTERMVSMNEHADGTMFCRVIKDLKIKDFNVGIASAIASYGRLRLCSAINAIKNVGGSVYYCDTDSIICDIKLNDYPELMEEFQWDGNGKELGSLKNECHEEVENTLKNIYPDIPILENKMKHETLFNELFQVVTLFNKRKRETLFNELLMKENGNMHFESCILTGCKQYSLSKDISVEGDIIHVEVCKLKGYSKKGKKLTHDDFRTLDEGKLIKQKQMQFHCPKSNYVSETEQFTIKTAYVNKKFRQTYGKGVVESDKTITPLRI